MSKSILILGESGTGKSTAIRTLPPEQTFVVSVEGKTLPFRGSSKSYTKLSSDGLTGNFYCSDDVNQVKRIIQLVNLKRPDIKYLVIDDCGYIVMNQFMRKCLERGYDKYSEIGKSFSDLLSSINDIREDLFCFVTMHIETDANGRTKPKTVGKMLDQYVCIEGKFTYVLHTAVSDRKYKFITNSDNFSMCKTPMDLFDEQYIDNDLLMVANKIDEYLMGEVI